MKKKSKNSKESGGEQQTLSEEDDLGLLGLGAGDGLDDVARVLRDAADVVVLDGELRLVVGGRVREDRLLAARLDVRDNLDVELARGDGPLRLRREARDDVVLVHAPHHLALRDHRVPLGPRLHVLDQLAHAQHRRVDHRDPALRVQRRPGHAPPRDQHPVLVRDRLPRALRSVLAELLKLVGTGRHPLRLSVGGQWKKKEHSLSRKKTQN